MDRHTTTSFTSLTETMVIHVLSTSGKSYYSAASITGVSGYVVHGYCVIIHREQKKGARKFFS